MYYHIQIEEKDPKKEMFEIDKTNEQEILEDTIIPYLQGKKFQFDGYFLDPEKINRFIIKKTDRPARELADIETRNMPTGLFMVVTPVDILNYHEYSTDITKQMFALGAERVEKTDKPINKNEDSKIDRRSVFIVHGHDKLALNETALFIRQLGFTPIIISKQANEGKTIIEKIESHSNVGFGVVLYTPCDVGAKDGEDLQPRARQNVVFEHGFLIGKIGRNNVAALLKEQVETPNDISGVVYIKMDDFQRWHVELAKELKRSGYDINMNQFFE